jgi:molybdopterin-guanine dinucleotide biosynthesis protein A
MNIALVLAGRRRSFDPVAEAEKKCLKAFVEIEGRSMIERVTTTLRDTGRFDSILICLPNGISVDRECPWLESALQRGDVTRVDAAESPVASVLRILETLPEEATLLVTTGDHPLLDAAMVNAFFAGMEAGQADAFGALADVNAIQALYPGMRRTALKFKDESRAGCNLFVFKRAGAPVVRFFCEVEAHRKEPFRLARHLGHGTLLRYLAGQLTLDDALKQLERKTGVRLQVIRLDDPHAGIDVDSLDDLQAARTIIRLHETRLARGNDT